MSQVIEAMHTGAFMEGNTRKIVLLDDYGAETFHRFQHVCHRHCVELDPDDTRAVTEFFELIHLYRVGFKMCVPKGRLLLWIIYLHKQPVCIG